MQAQLERVEEIESKYDVIITPHDANSTAYLDPVALDEVESFLMMMEALSASQKQNRIMMVLEEENISGVSTQANSTTTTWPIDCSNQVDQYVTMSDGSRIHVQGTVYYVGLVRKTSENGKVYLSGYISDCYVDGIYSGTQRFLSGSLNIQGSGTSGASYCPSGTILFEVSFQTLTVTGKQTFYYPIIDFVAP